MTFSYINHAHLITHHPMMKLFLCFSLALSVLTAAHAQSHSDSNPSTTANIPAADKATPAAIELMLNGMILDKDYFEYRLQGAIQAGQADTLELRLAIRDELYNRALLLEEAKKSGFTKNKTYKIMAQEVQDNVYIDLSLQDYLKKYPITDQDLKNEYNHQVKEAAPNGTIIEYHLATIVLSDENVAKELFKKVKRSNFAELAKEHSTDASSARGGDIGWINYAQFQTNLKERVSRTSPGHILKPIQLGNAWHIIHIRDRREGAPATFEQSVDRVKSSLVQQRRAKYLETLRDAQQKNWAAKKPSN